jgi:hypothetical protein
MRLFVLNHTLFLSQIDGNQIHSTAIIQSKTEEEAYVQVDKYMQEYMGYDQCEMDDDGSGIHARAFTNQYPKFKLTEIAIGYAGTTHIDNFETRE